MQTATKGNFLGGTTFCALSVEVEVTPTTSMGIEHRKYLVAMVDLHMRRRAAGKANTDGLECDNCAAGHPSSGGHVETRRWKIF